MSKIQIDLEAGTASFIEGMDRSASAIDKVGKRAEEGRGFLDRFKEGFEWEAGAEGFRVVFEKFSEGLEKISRQYEEVARMGRDAFKLGISVEDLSRFQHAANASGLDVTTLTTGIDRLNQSIGKIAGGDASAKQAADALAKLGLDAHELAEQDPAEAFKRVSAALAGMTDKFQRAAITQELLGRSGRELLPVMTDLQSLMQESDDIGFTRTAENVEAAERQEREMAKATDALKGALMDMATSGWAEKLVEGFAHAIEGADHLIGKLTESAKHRYETLRSQYNSMLAAVKQPLQLSGNTDHDVAAMKDRVDLEQHFYETAKQMSLLDLPYTQSGYQLLVKNVTVAHEKLEADQKQLEVLQGQKRAQDEITKAQEQSAHAAEIAADAEQATWEKAEKALDAAKARAREAGMDQQGKEFDKFLQLHPDSSQIDQFANALSDEKMAENQKKLAEEARRVWEESMTPMERYEQKLHEIDNLVKQHALTEEQGKKAALRVMQEMDQAQERQAKHGEERKAELVVRHHDFRMGPQQHSSDPAKDALAQAKQQSQLMLKWDTWFNQIWTTITQPNNSDNAFSIG